ncbi:MAG TPA: DUF4252 domain-containing protein [Bryobacteraceae bacterium]|nr:DUF4252 domain-containing protein [Bryobacteraceae bacterium]
MRLFLVLLFAAAAQAQLLDLTHLDRLDTKARESTQVKLDDSKLKLASQFLGDKGAEGARNAVANLKGVYVRSFEFDSKGSYTEADLEPIRKQLKADKNWSNFIMHKEDNEVSEIWFHKQPDGAMGGLAIIAAEDRELTVVNIVGPLNASSLGQLGGLGIPNLGGILGDAGIKKEPRAPRKTNEE